MRIQTLWVEVNGNRHFHWMLRKTSQPQKVVTVRQTLMNPRHWLSFAVQWNRATKSSRIQTRLSDGVVAKDLLVGYTRMKVTATITAVDRHRAYETCWNARLHIAILHDTVPASNDTLECWTHVFINFADDLPLNRRLSLDATFHVRWFPGIDALVTKTEAWFAVHRTELSMITLSYYSTH